MTDKELVEFIYDKLMVQGCQSVDSEQQCLYHGPNGTKCAIGWLIPDDDYDPEFERSSIYVDAFNGKLNPVGIYLRDHGHSNRLRLLSKIQTVHDCAGPSTFRSDIHRGFVVVCQECVIQAELKPVSHYENGRRCN